MQRAVSYTHLDVYKRQEVGKKYFEQLIDEMKEKKGVTQDVELTAEDLKLSLIHIFGLAVFSADGE